MKGFIKIFESVIASILILSSISFFFSYKHPTAESQAQFNHILAALQKNGSLNNYIKTNNVSALNTTLKDMLPKTVDFSVEVSGIPNPVIKIACVCTDAQESELSNRLSPLAFAYMSRTIEIRIDNGDGGDFNELVNSNADILFFYGYRSFSIVERDKLTRFLQNGTLFMLADLSESQVNDDVMNNNDFFGLQWDKTLPSSPNGRFIETENPGSVSYKISNYYSSLGGKKDDGFNYNPWPSGNNKIAMDSRTVVAQPPGNPVSSSLKVNEVGSMGRTVWMVSYNSLGLSPPELAEINMLLKASMLWASGEHYRMDTQFKIIPAAQSFRRYNYVHVMDGPEPFLASLKIWNVFY